MIRRYGATAAPETRLDPGDAQAAACGLINGLLLSLPLWGMPPLFYGHCHKPTALTAALACAADRVRPRQRPGQRHQGRDPGLELVEFLKRDPAAAARHSLTLCLISVLFIVNAEHIFT
jgi:hypothetical protein